MITQAQLINQVRSYRFAEELESALMDAIHSQNEVTPELLSSLEQIIDAYDAMQLQEAGLLMKEADILDDVSLELEALSLESYADDLEIAEKILDNLQAASPTQTNPSSQALPTPSSHEKDELDAVRDQLKALTNTQ